MKSITLLLLSSLFACLIPFSASAQTITVNYKGKVTDIGSFLVNNDVAVGDDMNGSFSYDTDPSGAGLISFSNSFGNGFIATMATPNPLFIQDDQQNGSATLPADGFIVRSSSTSNQDWNAFTNPFMQFGLRQENIVGQLWDDILPPDLNDWSLITLEAINAPDWRFLDFNATVEHFSDDQIRWAVESFSVSAVPVPAAAWLFGSSLIGLIGISRKSSKKSHI